MAPPHTLSTLAKLRRRIIQAVAATRIWDWWEFKVPTLLGVAYFCAAVCGVPQDRLWHVIVIVVGAIVPVASYVCVINDLTDIEIDRSAGKFNSMAGLSRAARLGWLFGCLGAGLVVGFLVAGTSRIAAVIYAANWIAFTLYSVPPVRLKNRGGWGVAADACGGQLLPVMSTAAIATGAGTVAPPAGMMPLLAVWSLALGVRAIMAHQAADVAHDRMAGATTLGARVGAERLETIGCRWLLPTELGALAALLLISGSGVVLGLAAAFLTGQWLVCRMTRRPLACVAGQPGGWLVMFRYYITLFPISCLVTLGLPSPTAFGIAACHFALFPGSWGLSPAAILFPKARPMNPRERMK